MSPANPSLIPGHKFQQFRSHSITTIWPKFPFKIVKIYFMLRELEVIFCHTTDTLIVKLHCHSQIRTTFSKLIPILIVPDTKYNTQTPCLIGTNLLSKIPSNQYPMSSLIPPIKSAIQVLQQRLHKLEETGGVYSNITASLDTTIPPHTTVTCSGNDKGHSAY